MNIKTTLSLADFAQMESMEKEYYGPEFITDYNEAFDWYTRFSFTTMAIEDQGRIVGFLDLFPITQETFDLISQGIFNDKNLTAYNIMDIRKTDLAQVNLFLSCIVIDRAYRKTDALKILLRCYVDYYNAFISRGILIDEIITDNVTHEGERFSKKIGFRKIRSTNHNSVVYGQKYAEFSRTITEL